MAAKSPSAVAPTPGPSTWRLPTNQRSLSGSTTAAARSTPWTGPPTVAACSAASMRRRRWPARRSSSTAWWSSRPGPRLPASASTRGRTWAPAAGPRTARRCGSTATNRGGAGASSRSRCLAARPGWPSRPCATTFLNCVFAPGGGRPLVQRWWQPSREYQLLLLSAEDRTRDEVLARASQQFQYPTFSPDGTHILYLVRAGGAWDMMVQPATGEGHGRALFRGIRTLIPFALAPDGRGRSGLRRRPAYASPPRWPALVPTGLVRVPWAGGAGACREHETLRVSATPGTHVGGVHLADTTLLDAAARA